MYSWSFPVLTALVFVAVGIGAGSNVSSTGAPAAEPTEPQIIEPAPAMFLGDYDGDGLPDVYAIYAGSGGRLFKNLGDGSFEDVTARAGLAGLEGSCAALWADFDRDADLDLYLVAERSDQKLFHNRGDGSFEDVTRMAGLSDVEGELDAAWIDYDADSLPDLSIRTASGDALYHNTGEKWFEPVVLGFPVAAPVDGGYVRTVNEDESSVVPGADDTLHGEDESSAARTPSERADVELPPARGRQSSSSSASFAPSQVAIGTLPPSAALGPVCAGGLFDQALPTNCISASSTPTLGELYPLSTSLNVSPSGNVGIGTASPGAQVEIHGSSPELVFFQSTATAQQGRIYGSSAGPGWHNQRLILQSMGGGGTYIDTLTLKGGYIGIGTIIPQHKLHVSGGDIGLDNNSSLRIKNTSGTFERVLSVSTGNLVQVGSLENATTGIQVITGALERVRVTSGGNVGIGTTTPTELLDVNGRTKTKCVTITGGCDIVEGFETGDQTYEPGTVVVIDAKRAGELVQSTTSYDRKVAGVVSGAGGVQPGLMLSQEGVFDGEIKVAMAGRVYVRCSAENGAIEPGDRLTTSATPGHAMKVTEGEHADGAVLGKAMSELAEGQGLVLVLVNLQ